MLVTDQAKLIRMGLDSLRVIGRGSAGVRLFNVADDEHVVSAAKIGDDRDDGEESLAEAETPEILATDAIEIDVEENKGGITEA